MKIPVVGQLYSLEIEGSPCIGTVIESRPNKADGPHGILFVIKTKRAVVTGSQCYLDEARLCGGIATRVEIGADDNIVTIEAMCPPAA